MNHPTNSEPAISGPSLIYNLQGATAVNAPTQNSYRKHTINIALNSLSAELIFSPIMKKLAGFKKLKANWDGYDAEKIKSKAIDAALAFIVKRFVAEQLIPFFIGPTRDGGVTVEYKFDNIKIVYRILANKKSLVIIKNNNQVISTVDLNSHNEAPYLSPSVVYRTVTT